MQKIQQHFIYFNLITHKIRLFKIQNTNCSDDSIWHGCLLWTVAKSLVLEWRLDFEGIGWYYMHVHRMHSSFFDNHPFTISCDFLK